MSVMYFNHVSASCACNFPQRRGTADGIYSNIAVTIAIALLYILESSSYEIFNAALMVFIPKFHCYLVPCSMSALPNIQ